MIRSLTLVLGMTAGALALATIATADPAAIKERQKIYKGIGDASKTASGMLRGAAPFELSAVQASLKTYSDGAKKLPSLFPDDSKTGDNTEALPKIWENKKDFEAKLAKFGSDADAALVAIKDEASFKAEFPKVLGNCKGCHDEYRVKK